MTTSPAANASDTTTVRPVDPNLQEKLDALPPQPGVYLFKDSKGRIIYVGKAKSLRSRVRSYFTDRDDGRYQYPRLVRSIRDVEVLLTRDEVEALRTEATLIRRHQPRYNVDLKDDKSFPYLKVTRESFPRVFLTRQPRAKDGDYYGPYTDLKPTKYMLRMLKGQLQIRDCNLPLTPEAVVKGKFKICLDYHLRRCGGPCEGKISQDEYARGIQRFVKFLQGRHDEIIAALETEMRQLAAALRFEEAALARDRLLWARDFSERQKRVGPPDADQDAVGFVREDHFAAFSIIRIRGGRIVGQSPFYMERAGGLGSDELLESFLVRQYDLVDSMPREIFLPFEPPDLRSLETCLQQIAGRKVSVQTPQRGEKRSLVELAQVNAEHLLLERRLMADKRDFVPRSIQALQDELHLEQQPMWIEGFDVSNLHGLDSVASMVVFKNAKPFKSAYRIFKIKLFEGIDDYASIGEAVRRRYSRILAEMRDRDAPDEEKDAASHPAFDGIEDTGEFEDEEASENQTDNTSSKQPACRLPDLVLIDGGKGQLGRAKEILSELGLNELPVVGLAKRLEELILPHQSEPIVLPRSSSALRLLQQIRDEAHRFAVTKHRLLRGKRQIKSRLDDIPGVGPSRREALLKTFGSVKRIAEADVEALTAVKGMNQKIARLVKEELNQ